MSTHEEATRSTATPMMGVFNNLVLFDQHVPQNTLSSIVPDLAVAWSWDEDKTALTFRLRQDVRWHDGKPFSAKDVKCTWDLLTGKSSEKLRVNPRRSWYRNLEEVTVDSDNDVTFHLKRPQPFLTALLASGASPVYPCHVSPAQMRQHPIGTGPFKFVEYKPNESIRLSRNTDYWKPGRPYLDGIEYTIMPNISTRMLAFTAGKVDMTFPYGVSIPLLKDVKSQAPQAICETTVATGSRTLIVNQTAPPFDNPELRRAIVLALDRKPFIDILSEGRGKIGGVMLPPPEGVWGMPPEVLQALPGYATDVQKNRQEARTDPRSVFSTCIPPSTTLSIINDISSLGRPFGFSEPKQPPAARCSCRRMKQGSISPTLCTPPVTMTMPWQLGSGV
jgi:peptide/nickel transport system substrate-binding protein